MKASRLIYAVSAVALALTSMAIDAPTASASLTTVNLRLVKKWSGLNQPLYFTAARGDAGRAFVVEKGGRIRVIRNGKLLSRPYLNISSKVSKGSEQGLLGLAFAPNFKSSGRFYVNYTDLSGNTVVVRYYTPRPNSDRPSFKSRVILKVNQPYANHNGGCLQFGPDGYLYIGMGDGGSAGDPDDRAQNPNDLLGKILRIDTGDSGRGTDPVTYGIPSTNPFVGVPGRRGEIWSLGMRNPWRFGFDRSAGHLWIGDVGQSSWEEIDFAPKGIGGRNFGWNLFEGKHTYPPGSVPPTNTAPYTMPLVEIPHPTFESVTGGYVYRGRLYPALSGVYVFGDFETGRIWGMRRLPSVRTRQLANTSLLISSFGQSARGELYLCDFKNGAVYRVTSR
jgi:glucose/arabinose dehydrogenase